MLWIFAIMTIFGVFATIFNIMIHVEEGWPRIAILLSVIMIVVGLYGIAAVEG